MTKSLRANYQAYVDTFRRPDGTLGDMLELKLRHTMRVVSNARLIAAEEHFAEDERVAAVDAALLHDTGRYEQLTRFNSFNDATTIDHAALSHNLVLRFGWLDGRADAQAILDAVRLHNRKELPAGLDRITTAAAQTVRDADKLDIFRVLENLVATTDWRTDSRAFWNLPIDRQPNPRVLSAIRAGESVDYSDILSLADFVLIQVGWMISGLYYPVSRRLARERGHLAFRRKFLAELGAGDAAEQVCRLAACEFLC